MLGFLLLCATPLLVVKGYDLTILHTNDVHARIDEAHKYGGICTPKALAADSCVGGAARLYTKINETRETRDNVLLLDGGDQFQGTFWFYVFQGKAISQFMKRLGYDAMALGNHEFDIGLSPLQDFINNVSGSFDVLSANIDNSKEGGLVGFKPFVIKQVGTRKVGIVGYTTADTPMLTSVGSTGKLVFKEVVQAVREGVRELKAQDSTVDIIIALGHAGFDIDKQIAKEVDDVDIVVGGHSNTFLWTGDKPSSEKPAGEYPYKVKKTNGKTALCVQAFTFTKYLGNLTVTFNDEGEVVSSEGSPFLLDATVAKDPGVEAMMEPYRTRVAAEGNKPIARTAVTLNSECRKFECNFGNIVADAWIHSNIVFGTDIKWARASIAIINGGSIRASIARGNVTNQDLLTSMPFANDIVTVTVNGKTMKDMFENSARAFDSTRMTGRFLQMAGAHVTYDLSKPDGQRVVDLQLRCLECEVPGYEPLKPNSNYTFLTSSFMAGGGDGYSMLRDERVDFENLGLNDATMVDVYMKAMASIYPSTEGRIKFTKCNCNCNSSVFLMPAYSLIALLAFLNMTA